MKINNYLDRIVLGTAGLGGAWRKIDRSSSIDTLLFALDHGIKHIDMAPAYMDAEEIVSEALLQWKGNPPILSTKVGKKKGMATQQGLNDYHPDQLESSLNNSLTILKRSQIDILFLHEPDQVPINRVNEVVEKLRRFKQQGMVKKLGFGGAPSDKFRAGIKDGVFDIVMDFNNYNLAQRTALKRDFPYYRKHNLEIHEASALMMGLLGSRLDSYIKEPPSWISKELMVKARALQALANHNDMLLSTMAHRFLMYSDQIDKMVIGPSNLHQLKLTLSDLQKGPLPLPLVNQINNISH